MQSHFILNTNEQYSIREDKTVIKHYKKQRITNSRTDIIQTNNVLKLIRKESVDISTNGKIIRHSINQLMISYFKYNYCNICKIKFISNISPVCCDNCRINNKKHSASTYMSKSVKSLRKSYVASSLQITTDEITDDLYKTACKRIQIKREIKQLKSKQNANN